MNNFIQNILKSFRKNKNILLDYETFKEDKVFKAELYIVFFKNKYWVTYSYFLKDYEEAVDLYEVYIHKDFSSLEFMYQYLENEELIDLQRFSYLLSQYIKN